MRRFAFGAALVVGGVLLAVTAVVAMGALMPVQVP